MYQVKTKSQKQKEFWEKFVYQGTHNEEKDKEEIYKNREKFIDTVKKIIKFYRHIFQWQYKDVHKFITYESLKK